MQKQIDDIAARAGIPSDLVKAALKTQHDKRVFDEAMKRAQEARLGSTTTTPKTEGERAAVAVGTLNTYIESGKPLTDGTPVKDENGFVTPVAWKKLIAEAPSEGLTRKQFIEQFGHLLFKDKDGKPDPSYGLTAQEIKLITGTLPT